MASMKYGFILLALTLTAVILPQTVTFAQSPPTVTQNEAIVHFPNDVVFQLAYQSDAPIVEAILSYEVEQVGCLDAASNVPVEITDGRLQWQWVMARSGNPPPGANLRWAWTLTDANGAQTTTPAQELTFEDGRFNWRTLSENNVNMNWYRGDDVGPILLEAAVAGLDRLENEMGIEMESEVDFYIYGDSQEMREAVIYIQDWAGGVAFSEYNTILMGVTPSSADDWGSSTVQHELAHLVIGQYGQSCIGGRRPTWLNEGLAVYAEGEPSETTTNAIAKAIANDSFAPLRSLNGAFPAHGEEAGSAYDQSYSVVNFMFDEYGVEKMQELLLALAAGSGYDEALENVYGMNVDGLETAWRTAVNAPPRAIPPTPTPITAANVPTAVAQSVPRSLPTPPEANNPPPVVTPSPAPDNGICGAAMIPLLLTGVFLSKRKKLRNPLQN